MCVCVCVCVCVSKNSPSIVSLARIHLYISIHACGPLCTHENELHTATRTLMNTRILFEAQSNALQVYAHGYCPAACLQSTHMQCIVTTNSLVDQIDLEEELNVITYRQPGRNSVIPFLLCAKRRLRDRSERRTDCHTTDEHVVPERLCGLFQFEKVQLKACMYFCVFYA